MIMNNLFYPFLTLILAIQLYGCGSPGARYAENTGGRKFSRYESFTNGDVRFDCMVACSGTWGANRDRIIGLYKNGLSKDVANSVMDIGFTGMVPYYLLGASAEDLGYPSAALTYYALANTQDCLAGTGCSDLRLPDALNERAHRLSEPKRQTNTSQIANNGTNNLEYRRKNCSGLYPWQRGTAARRVDCLNDDWNDYNPSIESYVNEFKKYRYGLALQVDAGEMNTTKYALLEKQGLDSLISKITPNNYTPPIKQTIESPRNAIYSSSNENQKTGSNKESKNAKNLSVENVYQPKVSNTGESNESSYNPLPRESSSYNEANVEAEDSGFMTAITSAIGTTLRLAATAAPIALSYYLRTNAARNAAAWNGYYNNMYRRPTTCVMTGNIASCN
jgi:hypothetical protein